MRIVEAVHADVLSQTALSNLYTKGVASKHDPKQKVRAEPGIPNQDTRRLLATLILEEAIETIHALGFNVYQNDVSIGMDKDELGEVRLQADYGESDISIDEVIDGACDTIYVATGALVACGVPDLAHLYEVCRANDEKFPKGRAIMRSDGKYLKPEGWVGPDHAGVRANQKHNMEAVSKALVSQASSCSE